MHGDSNPQCCRTNVQALVIQATSTRSYPFQKKKGCVIYVCINYLKDKRMKEMKKEWRNNKRDENLISVKLT